MKLILLLLLVSCAKNSITVTKINDFEYILSYNNGVYAPVDSVTKLSEKARTLCGNYTIKTHLGTDKYGDVKSIHIQCTL